MHLHTVAAAPHCFIQFLCFHAAPHTCTQFYAPLRSSTWFPYLCAAPRASTQFHSLQAPPYTSTQAAPQLTMLLLSVRTGTVCIHAYPFNPYPRHRAHPLCRGKAPLCSHPLPTTPPREIMCSHLISLPRWWAQLFAVLTLPHVPSVSFICRHSPRLEGLNGRPPSCTSHC